jgi:putative MATE family efflux protein
MNVQTIANPTTAPSPAGSRPMAARTRMILEEPIFPTLLRLSVPNVLNLLAFVGLITFDGLFIGRLGPDALAGVTLAFPWVMLVQHTAASGMGGGVASAVARALGAGQRARADALAYHAFILALALAAIFSTVMLVASPLIFRWMGGQGEMLSAALSYSRVAFAGAVSICMLNLLGNVVRGTGNMALPAGVIVGSVIGHVLLSPVLIFGCGPIPPLGPAGAGWGLITSFSAGGLVLIWYLRSGRSLVTLVFRGVPLNWELFADILKVGVPGLINVGITNLSVVVLTGVAGNLGKQTAIAYGMGARLEYILIPLAFGFGTAIVAMVGTNWGAKQYRRAQQIGWIGAATVGLTCAAVGLFFAVLPELWMRLFTGDAEIVGLGVTYLRTVGPFYGCYGLGMALYFATQGLGRPMATVASNGLRLLVSACAALFAVYVLEAGAIGAFMAIALGFVVYGGLNVLALLNIKEPVGSSR